MKKKIIVIFCQIIKIIKIIVFIFVMNEIIKQHYRTLEALLLLSSNPPLNIIIECQLKGSVQHLDKLIFNLICISPVEGNFPC